MRSGKALLGCFALAFAIAWGGVLVVPRQTAPQLVFVAMLLDPSVVASVVLILGVLAVLSRWSPVLVPAPAGTTLAFGIVVGRLAGTFEELDREAHAMRPTARRGARRQRGTSVRRGKAPSRSRSTLYEQTGSVLLGMLLHASFTGSQAVLWPRAAPPSAELLWYGLFAVGLWVVVAAVLRARGASAAHGPERLVRS